MIFLILYCWHCSGYNRAGYYWLAFYSFRSVLMLSWLLFFIKNEQAIIQIINVPSIILWYRPAYGVNGSESKMPTNTIQFSPQINEILDKPKCLFNWRKPIPIANMLRGTKMYVNNPVKLWISCEILGFINSLLHPLSQGNMATITVAIL